MYIRPETDQFRTRLIGWYANHPPGGTNWATLDSSTYDGDLGTGIDHPIPSSIAIDEAGNICVVGRFLDFYFYGTNGMGYGGANWSWFTRQYSAAARQWNTTDLFSYSTSLYGTNMQSAATGTAIAPDGSTFVVGYGGTQSGLHRWVVRKRAAARPPPRLQIASMGGIVSVSWPSTYTNSTLEWTDSCGTNQVWQPFSGSVIEGDGQNTVNLEPGPGARFFRLQIAAGQ